MPGLYKISKDGTMWVILENCDVVFRDKSKYRVEEVYRSLLAGSGFNGRTPNFMKEKS
jgi:hypothetical protein